GRDAFRRRHNLENKFVVMYSGNHSPCHPLETLVRAARQLEDSPEIVFCFVGGGSEHRKLREQPAPNIRVLPYQPLEDLAGSLSAADLHVAVMGEEFCGIVHPCKIYNILTIGAPLLYIGPPESHITDIGGEIRGSGFYQAAHGDCDTVIRHIRSASQHGGRAEYPARVLQGFGASRLIPEMVNVLQSALVRRR
ncbi:MAG: glycosyltransferase, partial [Candidatus Korobacteraceae bacterium]